MPEFPCDGPIDANIRLGSGLLEIVAEERSTVSVTLRPQRDSEAGRELSAATRVQMTGNALTIDVPKKGFGFILRGGSLRITVRVPLDSRVDVGTSSADITMVGRLGTATTSTASGDLRADVIAGDLSHRSASGDVHVNHVSGNATLASASGDIRIASVGGELLLGTASGDVFVDRVAGSLKATSASGDVRINSVSVGETRITTASGDVQVGVAEGTAVWLDVNTRSGDARSELDMSGEPADKPADLKLAIHTLSGDVVIRRAAPAPVAS